MKQDLPQRIGAFSEGGGQTKTTTAVALAVSAAKDAEDGEEVILFDCDPRGSTTKLTGATPAKPGLHLGSILSDREPYGFADDLAVRLDPKDGWPRNLRVVPCAKAVSNYEKSPDDHADIRILQSLQGVTGVRTFVFDMPNRQGGLITQNVLTAIDTIVYATKPDEEGLDGLEGARETVRDFMAHRQAIGAPTDLHEAGIVLGCAYKGAVQNTDALRAIDELDRLYPGELLRPFIPDLVIVKKARSALEYFGKYKAAAPVVEAYREIYRKVRR